MPAGQGYHRRRTTIPNAGRRGGGPARELEPPELFVVEEGLLVLDVVGLPVLAVHPCVVE